MWAVKARAGLCICIFHQNLRYSNTHYAHLEEALDRTLVKCPTASHINWVYTICCSEFRIMIIHFLLDTVDYLLYPNDII